MPLQSGSRLGPYELTAPLGAGGMGEVWRARDTKLDREVALKFLPASLAQGATHNVRRTMKLFLGKPQQRLGELGNHKPAEMSHP